jgi:hypothetical protein
MKKTAIHAWSYTGSILGYFKGLFKALDYLKKHHISLKELFTYIFYFVGDWKKTDTIIDLNLANRPCMTTEIYPNKQKARIFLCTTHPEYMIWHGGTIKEASQHHFNCIGHGFHRWEGINKFSEDGKKELMHTWWVIRRAVAWAAQLPPEDLPPIQESNENQEKADMLRKDIFWDGTLQHQLEKI